MSLDIGFLLDQEKLFVTRFLDAFAGGFAGKVPVGCLHGDRGQINCGGFGLPARLLDLAQRHPANADALRAAVALMTVHFKHAHCFRLPDGSLQAPGETVLRHPVLSYADFFDGDLQRHQDWEWLARFDEYEEQARAMDYTRGEHLELCAGLALRLYRATDPMRLREVDFRCEGAHGRMKVAGNLAWMFKVLGDERLIQHADLCVLAPLFETKRTLPTGGFGWAGGDEFEVGSKNTSGKWVWRGNPIADHRSASGWHVGDVTRFLFAVFVNTRTPAVREACLDWVLTWADQAFQKNGIVRWGDGIDLDELGIELALSGEPVPRLCSATNWVYDNEYNARNVEGPDGYMIWRRYYPFHKNPGEPAAPVNAFYGVQLDWEQPFGWSGLFQIAYQATRQERYRLAADLALRDALYWPHKAGAATVCKVSERKLDWYGPNSNWSGGGRNIAWRLTAPWGMPMGGTGLTLAAEQGAASLR